MGAASCWGEGGLAGDLNADLGVVAAGADAGVVGREKEAIGRCKLRKDALLFAGEAEVLAWVGVPATPLCAADCCCLDFFTGGAATSSDFTGEVP